MKSAFQWLVVLAFLVGVCLFGYQRYQARNASLEDTHSQAKRNGLLKTEVEFRNKLAELHMQKDKVERGIKSLNRLKSETIEQLKQKGVSSGSDFLSSQDTEIKKVVVNLKGYAEQIEKIQGQLVHYNEAISSIGMMLDRIERERISSEVSLSEDQYLDIRKIIVDLDERLDLETNPWEDEKLGEFLDQELSPPGQ